ncbi:LOW QUALITY PROTEIN: hypothetical protein V2J09_006350 [Rumex salicifolius]
MFGTSIRPTWRALLPCSYNITLDPIDDTINTVDDNHPGDYVRFLCSLSNVTKNSVENATGGSCNDSFEYPSDLNLPSITITALKGTRTVRRMVASVGTQTETYVCSVLPTDGLAVQVTPSWFTIPPLGLQLLDVILNATTQKLMSNFSFGAIILTGNLDHIVRIPLSLL